MGKVNGKPKAFASSVIVRKHFDGEVFTRYAGPHPGNPRHKQEGYKDRFEARKRQSYPTR